MSPSASGHTHRETRITHTQRNALFKNHRECQCSGRGKMGLWLSNTWQWLDRHRRSQLSSEVRGRPVAAPSVGRHARGSGWQLALSSLRPEGAAGARVTQAHGCPGPSLSRSSCRQEPPARPSFPRQLSESTGSITGLSVPITEDLPYIKCRAGTWPPSAQKER